MTRAQQTLSTLLILASIYLSCYLGLIPLPSKVQTEVVPVLPLWGIVSFGAYLLAKLGYGVLTFNNVPEAHKKLMAEIKEAKQELRSKGIDVD